MAKLLRQLINSLSDTIAAWDQFQQKEIGYFVCQREPPVASPSLKSSVTAVEKSFGKLKVLHGILQNLSKELCEENPQGVSYHFHTEFEVEMHLSTVLRDTD